MEIIVKLLDEQKALLAKLQEDLKLISSATFDSLRVITLDHADKIIERLNRIDSEIRTTAIKNNQ